MPEGQRAQQNIQISGPGLTQRIKKHGEKLTKRELKSGRLQPPLEKSHKQITKGENTPSSPSLYSLFNLPLAQYNLELGKYSLRANRPRMSNCLQPFPLLVKAHWDSCGWQPLLSLSDYGFVFTGKYQPSVLPGACIIHLPKCKTVVLGCEVLGGRNGMARWYLLIFLNSENKK